MKRFLVVVGLIIAGITAKAENVDSLTFGSFGKVLIYHPQKTPTEFILFISGDGGWKNEVISKANYLIEKGGMVVGIDINRYLKGIKLSKSKSVYLAGELEELSMTIQKKNKFSRYIKPILVGYSSGATLVYGALSQAPANTFKGAIAIGFCPDVDMCKPLSRGSGLEVTTLKEGKSYYLKSFYKLTAPLVILNGSSDKVCRISDIRKFVCKMPNCELDSLPNVGHGFKVVKNWLPQFLSAYNKIIKDYENSENDFLRNSLQLKQPIPLNNNLPLTIIPTTLKENLPIAFFISGDGGWTSFDQSICDKLAERGMPVIGLDAQKYFWEEKNPQKTANEISVVVEHFMQKWNKTSFVMIGYSFGACVVPFIANDFADSLKRTLKNVYCMSPDETGDFEIHVVDMLSMGGKGKYDVLSELKKIKSLNPVCIFGVEEEEDERKHFLETGAKIRLLPGSHHYDEDFNAVVTAIMKDFTPANQRTNEK
jgi:type IV secretory pathway VirJ component